MAYSTISKPSLYFNTKLYTGNGSTNAQTGVGFQPDWLWVKCRSDANGSQIFDALRTTYSLSSNDASAEANRASDGFTSLDSDGFTMNGSGSGGSTNVNSRTYAAWNWKANGAGSANTDGSITSSVSANTTAGFSIVSYTGTGSNATVGHSLGTTPSMIIFKNRDSITDWRVYHKTLGATKGIRLSSNGTEQTSSTYFNNTEPTSSLFTVSTAVDTNENTSNFIAYCFAEKKGYSKFGSYTGNGNADGTFVYTGFKPALVIAKSSSAAHDWIILDNKRSNPFNPVDGNLFPNLSDVEGTATKRIDFTSQGFKNRSAGTGANESGTTYIYMAFAEEPLVANLGASIPATAR